MKKQIVVSMMVLGLVSGLYAQNLSNRDFEEWTTESFGGSSWEDPDNWDTPNSGTALLGLKLVFKEDANVNQGDFAVRMVTSEIPLLGIIAPSALTTGTLVPNLSDPTNTLLIGGSPIHERATSLTGYYDYQPMGGDSMTARVRMLFIDGTDTLIISEDEITDEQTSGGYVFFEIPINYLTTDVPDLIQVLFRSTRNTLSAHVGTTLYVDNLSLTGVTSAVDAGAMGMQIDQFPNPAAEVFNVRLPDHTDGQFVLIDNTGKRCLQRAVRGGLNQMDVSQLPVGIYFYAIYQANQRIYGGKLCIQR